jgi:Predicted membrane protein
MNLNRFCYLLLVLAAIASLLTPHPVPTWLLLVNVLTLAIYGGDKLAARRAWRRVPESTLLAFGVLGGWPGAIVGQQLFSHKTQKQPFKTYFFISVVLSLAAMAAAYAFYPVSAWHLSAVLPYPQGVSILC